MSVLSPCTEVHLCSDLNLSLLRRWGFAPICYFTECLQISDGSFVVSGADLKTGADPRTFIGWYWWITLEDIFFSSHIVRFWQVYREQLRLGGVNQFFFCVLRRYNIIKGTLRVSWDDRSSSDVPLLCVEQQWGPGGRRCFKTTTNNDFHSEQFTEDKHCW